MHAKAFAMAGLLLACGEAPLAPLDLGTDAAGDGTEELGPEDLGPRPPTTSEVRILHLAPNAGGVDVFTDGVPTPLFDVRYPSSTRPIFVPAATYDLALAPRGEGVEAAVIDLPAFPLEAGSAWSFVAFGELADGVLPSLALAEDYSEPTAGALRLRVVHVGPGLGPVDVFAGERAEGTRWASALAEGASEVQDLPADGLNSFGDPIDVLITGRGDGMSDATIPVPFSVFEDARFVSLYLVRAEEGPVLFAHSRAESTPLVGPLMPLGI